MAKKMYMNYSKSYLNGPFENLAQSLVDAAYTFISPPIFPCLLLVLQNRKL